MVCFRLIFKNHHTFDVIVHRQVAARGYDAAMHAAKIYRVTSGAREIEPLQRAAGGPIEVYAISEATAVSIASEVLSAVTGSELAELSIFNDPALPGLPELA